MHNFNVFMKHLNFKQMVKILNIGQSKIAVSFSYSRAFLQKSSKKVLSVVGISEVLRIQPHIEGDIRTGADITKLAASIEEKIIS